MQAGAGRLAGARFQVLGEILRLGYAVLLTDMDVVTVQSPFPHLHRDSDLEAASDGFTNATAYGACCRRLFQQCLNDTASNSQNVLAQTNLGTHWPLCCIRWSPPWHELLSGSQQLKLLSSFQAAAANERPYISGMPLDPLCHGISPFCQVTRQLLIIFFWFLTMAMLGSECSW